MFVAMTVAAVAFGGWLYVNRMERIHWRQLTLANIEASEQAGRLILFESSKFGMWVRLTLNPRDDYMISRACGWKLNWHNVDCYRLDAEILPVNDMENLESITSWMERAFGTTINESVTHVEIYDPVLKTAFPVPERDSETVNRIIDECLERRKGR
jgi:hypothetical protein